MSRIRRFQSVLSAAALLSGLLLVGPAVPASAAGPFDIHVLTNSCTTTGGRYGYGKVVFRVRGIENGTTGTNYMRARSKIQRWNGSRWETMVTGAWAKSEGYPDNSDSYYVDFDRSRFDVPKLLRNYYHRLRTTVEFWDQRPGPDKLVGSRTRVSKNC